MSLSCLSLVEINCYDINIINSDMLLPYRLIKSRWLVGTDDLFTVFL